MDAFRSAEDEEREFWATEDSTDFVDWSKAKRVAFRNLKRTLRTIRSVAAGDSA